MTELEIKIREICLELIPVLKENIDTNMIEAMLIQKFTGYTIKKVEKELVIYKEDENQRLFKWWLASKKINGCTNRTINFYSQSVGDFLSKVNKNITDVEANDIRGYMFRKQKNGASLVHCNNIRRCLSSFFTFLQVEDYIRMNPIRKIPPFRATKKIKKPLTSEEIEKIRLSCETKLESAVFEFMYSTACRAAEMFILNREDVDLENARITVFGKGKKERIVFLTPRAKLMLIKYLETRDDDHPSLFLLPFKKRTDGKEIYKEVRPDAPGLRWFLNKLGRRAGVSIQPHKIRRTAATQALRKGMDIDQIRVLLGHESVNTTLLYAQTDDQQLERDHAKYLG